MARWKELGEVPDSDEESLFDSDESQHQVLPQLRGNGREDQVAASPTTGNDDGGGIWDVPTSSQGVHQSAKGRDDVRTHASSHPPEQLPTGPEASTPVQPPESNNEESVHEPADQSPNISSRESSPLSMLESDIEPDIQPSTERPAASEEDANAALQDTPRPIREFRRRKPIQEHPYLLESAYYSSVLKSHGIRPLKNPVAEEPGRKRQEEDSQEQDYEDDSQKTAEVFPGFGGSSQVSQGLATVDDRDELALSPSSLAQSPSGGDESLADYSKTVQAEEEELPSLNEIFKNPRALQRRTFAKRKRSPNGGPWKRKTRKAIRSLQHQEPSSSEPRAFDVFDIPPSPPQTSPAFLSRAPVAGNMVSQPKPSAIANKPSSHDSATVSRDQTPAPVNEDSNMIDLTLLEDLDSSAAEEDDTASSGPDSEDDETNASGSPEQEPNMTLQRKIRGVLPASWIRIDQQIGREKVHGPAARPNIGRSPERSLRKGVAQRRHASPKPTAHAPFFFDDHSDDDMSLRSNDADTVPNSAEPPIFEDDAGSVIEEDHIDHMLPTRKRKSCEVKGRQRTSKRRKAQTIFQGHPKRQKRQQRITGLLSRPKSAPRERGSNRGPSGQSSHLATRKPPPKPKSQTSATVPRLGVLDVLEPDAPLFMRVAARTARQKSGQGRSSPAGKQIRLGTRKDNLDALETLRNWNIGKIQPRNTIAAPLDPRPQQVDAHRLLQPESNNALSRISAPKTRKSTTLPGSRFSRPTKLKRQGKIDRFFHNSLAPAAPGDPEEAPGRAPAALRRQPLGQPASHGGVPRPAQLEMAGEETVSRYVFNARKRALDAMYRKSHLAFASPGHIRLDRILREPSPTVATSLAPKNRDHGQAFEPSPLGNDIAAKPRPRLRKPVRPRRVDIAAPQYAHANDPLPVEVVSTPEIRTSASTNLKLMGLGSFGAQYTHHFEVFPLEPGVFFQESTVIGDGRLARAFEGKTLDGLDHPRGHCLLVLDGTMLRWGQWDDLVSSEIGVLLDCIHEQLQSTADPDRIGPPSPAQAADFILRYLQDFVSFNNAEDGRSFIKRMLEVLSNLVDRMGALFDANKDLLGRLSEVMTRFLIIIFQILRICEKLTLPESLQTEELLKKAARQMAQVLLGAGLSLVQNLFDRLHESSFRERGIGNEHATVVAWVVLMRVLQGAHLPRAGFWDVVTPVFLGVDLGSVYDAHTLERMWHDLFILLPLGEFDNNGVAIPGLRNTMPLEGWALPQKLIGRVFCIYQSNGLQSPSFNQYCRAMVGRCHYLVEQWGWRRCNGIIGTIFDFFAAQKLSHLRNEEAYRSPQFLEDLGALPSLAILPEDRCFHIFLKLLALAIQRLRKLGLIKDMRNLIARVLPNHDRQFLKEKDVHESELAALRNHHDLLCTLFWSAPPDLRPSVQTVEKLVLPGSSHKEACLINVRAWNQLARFVIASRPDGPIYEPFIGWQNNLFRQMLDQYMSVEDDIRQQFLRLTHDASEGISDEMSRRVINMNKQAVADVLHSSLRATLDVMQHAQSLGAASLVVNHYQLEEVFTRFSYRKLDWGTLRVALDTVGYYVSRVEAFLDEEVGPWHGEDSPWVKVLVRNVSASFFSMTRAIISPDFELPSVPAKVSLLCTDQALATAGRIAALLLEAGSIVPSQLFSRSHRLCLFEAPPKRLPLASRGHACLFIASFLERRRVEFMELGTSSLELFLCAITRPMQALAHEGRLAEAMKRCGEWFLQDAPVRIGHDPDYNMNRDLFDHVVKVIRRTMRLADTEQQRKQRKEAFRSVFRTVMDQMRQDLTALADTPEHADYMAFVQQAIHLIKSHDVCAVDQFFFEISREYAPPEQDPGLQTAGILSYGYRLEDAGVGFVSSFFTYLYSNFKGAVSHRKLEDQRAILEASMRHAQVWSFMIPWMMPAIIRTAVQVPYAWLLLDVSVGALEQWFEADCIHRELGQGVMGDLLALLAVVYGGIQHLQSLGERPLQPEEVHVLAQMLKLVNLFGPSIAAYLLNHGTSETGKALKKRIETFTVMTQAASDYLSSLLRRAGQGSTLVVDSMFLFEAVVYSSSETGVEGKPQIDDFSQVMMKDMKDNWERVGSVVSVKGPGRSGPGTQLPQWDMRELAAGLLEQAQKWHYAHDRRARTRADEACLF